ncbi:MAG TPA: hypothetical protein VFZ92_09050 [Umezawaea sp.]
MTGSVEDGEKARQQDLVDRESAVSAAALCHGRTTHRPEGDERERWLHRCETRNDERERGLDSRAAELGRRQAEQDQVAHLLDQQERQVRRREREADQREIDAQTWWPGSGW